MMHNNQEYCIFYDGKIICAFPQNMNHYINTLNAYDKTIVYAAILKDQK